jgi:hypothetical protein
LGAFERPRILAILSLEGVVSSKEKPGNKKGFGLSTETLAVQMVGVEGFELSTSCSQSKRATGLRHTPNRAILPNPVHGGQSHSDKPSEKP